MTERIIKATDILIRLAELTMYAGLAYMAWRINIIFFGASSKIL